MRAIDHWVGVPLCALATPLVWLIDQIRRQDIYAAPRRALFIELSEMGSAVIADPAMRKMQATGAEVFFVIFAKNAPSLGLLNTVPARNVFRIREDGLVSLALSTIGFLWWARRNQIDTVIDLELFSRYSGLLTGLSGAAKRVGFHAFHNEGLFRGDMLTHKVAYNPHMHIAKSFLSLVHAATARAREWPFSKVVISDDEIKLAKAPVDAALCEEIRSRVRQEFKAFEPSTHRIVLINPNSSDLLPQRRWPIERYVELMAQIISKYPNVLVLITGSPSERDAAENLRAMVNDPRCINFAGRLKFQELPSLYQVSSLMVSNDSGPGHFSAVTSLPTVVLFGPETPKLYGSLGNTIPIYAGLACSPCVSAANHRKTPCTRNICMDAIGVNQVMGRVEDLLLTH